MENANTPTHGAGVLTWVWVHGYLGSSEIWGDLHTNLSQKHSIVPLDLPGFGSRAGEVSPDSIGGFADYVLQECTRRGIQTFGLMGHSMGGQISQEVAIRAPDRVKALVLYGTGPVGAMPGRFETIERSRERLQEDGVTSTAMRIAAKWFVDQEASPPWAWVSKLAQGVSVASADRCLKAMGDWRREDDLGSIQCPTQVIWGELDRSYAWPEQIKLWHGIKGVSMAVLPRCSHAAHLEAPVLFQRVVDDFCELNARRD